MTIEISTRSDYGTKSKQPVNSETPDNVSSSRVRMEDHCEVVNTGKRAFVSVADGHGSVSHTPTVYLGGYESAVVATRTAVKNMKMPPVELFKSIQKAVYRQSSSLASSQSMMGLVDDYFIVQKSSSRTPIVYSMHGCTLSCLNIKDRKFECSWVGDSSVLLYRQSRASWVTTSHDVHDSSEVDYIIANGGSRYGKSYVKFKLPNKEEYLLQMTRSIGHFGNNAVRHIPSIVKGSVEPGDVFVAATDGLWKYVSVSEVEAILARSESVDDMSAKLLELAVSKRSRNRDNACIVVVRVHKPNRTWLPRLILPSFGSKRWRFGNRQLARKKEQEPMSHS